MSYSTIRAAVKTKLESITGIENVHDYVIWSDDWDTLLSNFSADNKIQEWYIGLGGVPDNTVSAGDKKQGFTVNIYGLYGMHTATESSKLFEDLIMDVIDAFSTSFNVLELPGVNNMPPTLPGPVENTIWAHFPVHRAIINLTITEIVNQELLCKG